MAAGLGYKEFTTGDVLTAADANGYLASQVVMVFASSAARSSAITSPQEGMIAYLKDTNAVEKYDGAAWVSVGGGGGGKVLQVVQGTSTTTVTSATTTFADTTVTATITPSSATSKILVMVSHALKKDSGSAGPRMSIKLVRGATDIATPILQALYTATDLRQNSMFSYQYLDSPSTTSATTYKTQFANQGGAGADVIVQPNGETGVIILMEIGA